MSEDTHHCDGCAAIDQLRKELDQKHSQNRSDIHKFRNEMREVNMNTGTYVILHDLTSDPNWKKNISPSVNSVLSDDFRAQPDNATGDLDVINEGGKEMAGGLVSTMSCRSPPRASSAWISVSASTGRLQAPGALRERSEDHAGRWSAGERQLPVESGQRHLAARRERWGWLGGHGSQDADGAGREPHLSAPGIRRKGLVNHRPEGERLRPVHSAGKFQNLPAAQTGWTPGLHPQLQTEIKKAPYVLQESFHRVRVLESDGPIPYSFD
jgi:hypothetical protein